MSLKYKAIDEFLDSCGTSAETYDNFKYILDSFLDQDRRQLAHRLMVELQDYYFQSTDPDEFQSQYHFFFHKISLGPGLPELILLQLPSIFSPEEWSFTFFEGLSRFPRSQFVDEDMVELGCGNGWITIALAKRNRPRKIYGLDINPKSITCAQINLYMNSFDRDSQVIADHENLPLWERVEFHVSDLLEHIRTENIKLDRVVGCIPQVLAPDPEDLLRKATESDTDQALYDLSNYTEAHGYLEDQFGLGLIAKALEESVDCLRPSGSIIFNLGGRPGISVLEGVFLRRGFDVKRLWSTRVEQAGDTDIQALVEIESSSSHRFEFYMAGDSREAISAKTAQAYGKSGGKIAHSLSVYEAKLPAHEQVATILEYLSKPENKSLHDALDLSNGDKGIYLERVRFLAYLAELFNQQQELPYGETQGIQGLRENIAGFTKVFFRAPIGAEQVLVGPSRSDLLCSYFKLYKPKKVLIDQELISCYFPHKGSQEAHWGANFLEAPRRSDLVVSLMKSLKPDLLLTTLTDFENKSSTAFESLVSASLEYGVQLVLDISDYLDLSSEPEGNAIFSFMAKHPLPSNVSLICGLVKNRVYEDLKLAFLISENNQLINQMTSAAELTYSRAALMVQHYYKKILDDLLGFHMINARGLSESWVRDEYPGSERAKLVQPSASAEEALNHPSIKRNELNLTRETLRLDYGENALTMPGTLVNGIYEAFVRKAFDDGEADPTGEIKAFLKKEYSLEVPSRHLVYGSGVAPLFASILIHIDSEGESILFPKGSYGEFVASAQLFNVPISFCETGAENQFKLSPQNLHEALAACEKKVWIFLNGPIVNPTGASYSSGELQELLNVAKAHGARLIFDSTFAGLQFNGTVQNNSLEHALNDEMKWVFLGGVSKLLAAGGLRFAYGFTNQQKLFEHMSSSQFEKPHQTVKYAMKKIYRKLVEGDPELIASLSQQRSVLGKRAKVLSDLLIKCGWSVLPSAGGLFIVARPDLYLGRTFHIEERGERQRLQLDGVSCAKALFTYSKVLINGPDWTGLDGYCRFVLSVSEAEFNNALKGIQEFHKEFLNQNPQ